MMENKEKLSQSEAKFESEGEIFLDKEGNWYHEGILITHPGTIALFSRSVVKDPSGGYRLQIGKESAKIIVEDTPYMVRRVEIHKDCIMILLNDGIWEKLEPATLWIGKGNVLYCKVKSGEFPARFLRPAYYQIMQLLEEDGNGFFIKISGQRWALKPG